MSKLKLRLIFPLVLHSRPALQSAVPCLHEPLRPVRCGNRLTLHCEMVLGHPDWFDAWAAWHWTISKCQLMLTPLVLKTVFVTSVVHPQRELGIFQYAWRRHRPSPINPSINSYWALLAQALFCSYAQPRARSWFL